MPVGHVWPTGPRQLVLRRGRQVDAPGKKKSLLGGRLFAAAGTAQAVLVRRAVGPGPKGQLAGGVARAGAYTAQ